MPSALHPLNAALRFVLELGALFGLGTWGHALSGGYGLAIALPLVAASTWGVFTVPGDPSRGKAGPVRVSGVVRLLLEAVFFTAGTCGLAQTGHETLAIVFGVSVCLHYALAHARTRWLLAQR